MWRSSGSFFTCWIQLPCVGLPCSIQPGDQKRLTLRENSTQVSQNSQNTWQQLMGTSPRLWALCCHHCWIAVLKLVRRIIGKSISLHQLVHGLIVREQDTEYALSKQSVHTQCHQDTKCAATCFTSSHMVPPGYSTPCSIVSAAKMYKQECRCQYSWSYTDAAVFLLYIQDGPCCFCNKTGTWVHYECSDYHIVCYDCYQNWYQITCANAQCTLGFHKPNNTHIWSRPVRGSYWLDYNCSSLTSQQIA